MVSTRDRVPGHLRHLIVEQNEDVYNVIDHAVWRFVLLNLQSILKDCAYSQYNEGLRRSGITVERIPSIATIDRCLSEFGWGAVAVDGFIPPRAFQELQSLRILPIAAEIRTLRQLAYTPAPDIIHEAAGHAPILLDPDYAAYIEMIGRVGRRAFEQPSDRAVYRAIYALSELKGTASATTEQLEAAEQTLARTLAQVRSVSESGRLARLYWWTAEYGLIGTPSDYQLFGAGLLSSMGEGHSCHDARVEKRLLSADCVDVDYDITRPQPQLFVCRSFHHAKEVLHTVAGRLALAQPPTAALTTAVQSEEVATLVLRRPGSGYGVLDDVLTGAELSGVCVSGRVVSFTKDAVWVEGPYAWVSDGRAIHDLNGDAGKGMALLTEAVSVLANASAGDRVDLTVDARLRIRGTVERVHRQRHGDLCVLRMATLQTGEDQQQVDRLVVPVGLALHAVVAGPYGPEFFATRYPSDAQVPSTPSDDFGGLLRLYEAAVEAWRGRYGGQVVRELEVIHQQLDARFKDEWLLRWNLLECLMRLGQASSLQAELRAQLWALESHFAHVEPIATGLRTLDTMMEEHEQCA